MLQPRIRKAAYTPCEGRIHSMKKHLHTKQRNTKFSAACRYLPALFLLLLLSAPLTGCGRKTPDLSPSNGGKGSEENSDAEDFNEKTPGAEDADTDAASPAPFSHAASQEISAGTDYVFPKTAPFIDDTGKSMQRDGNCLYSYHNGRLIRFDAETEETNLLYQTASTHMMNFCLHKNDIYFVERTGFDSLDDRDTSLWRMGKDGKSLTLLQRDIVNAGTMRDYNHYTIDIYDDIIYLICYTSGYENGDYVTKTANLYYRLENDGSVSEVDESETLYGALPRRFSPVFAWDFPTLPYAMRNYGYIFMQDPAKTLFRMDPDSGARESLGIHTEDYSYFAFSGNLVFRYSYYADAVASLFDLDDNSSVVLDEALPGVLSYLSVFPAEEGFYFCGDISEEDSSSGETLYRFHICRILPDGSVETLIADPPRSYEDSYDVSQIRDDSCVLGGHLYYYESDDAFQHLMRLPVQEKASPREIDTFPRYPASSPAAVFEEEREEETPIGDGSSVSLSVRKLFLEERTAADKAINQILSGVYADFESYVDDLIRDEQEALEEDPDFYDSFDYASFYDFSLHVSLDYMDDDTISFCCDYYQYYAYAAHGYYWSDYYVFDRRTGERLSFEDFVGNSAAVMKTAAPYVEKMAEWEFDEEMLLDISRFSLSEDGYTLYFAPYDIGCYAAGAYLITIPYEAFEATL